MPYSSNVNIRLWVSHIYLTFILPLVKITLRGCRSIHPFLIHPTTPHLTHFQAWAILYFISLCENVKTASQLVPLITYKFNRSRISKSLKSTDTCHNCCVCVFYFGNIAVSTLFSLLNGHCTKLTLKCWFYLFIYSFIVIHGFLIWF